MTATFLGFGMSAIAASRSTMACRPGSCSGVTVLAPVVASTIRSEPKYWNRTIKSATMNMKTGSIPARNSSPMKATYTSASRNIVNDMRKVSSRSLP